VTTRLALRSILALPLVAALAAPACTSTPTEPASSTGAAALTASATTSLPRNYVPMNGRSLAADFDHLPTAPSNLLQYFGGPILGTVTVYTVFWGPNVDATVVSALDGYYTTILGSEYFKWLSEYSTAGVTPQPPATMSSNQMLTLGNFGGHFTINPPQQTGTIGQAYLEGQLASAIQAGTLPPAQYDANSNPMTLYMMYFPPGLTITTSFGSSCGAWCGYHEQALAGTRYVSYGVMPDLGACGYCGDSSELTAMTAVSSHELAEAVTDAQPTLNNAWYSQGMGARQGEIGDLCNGLDVPYLGYTVQALWSNLNGRCIVLRPVCDATMSNAPCRQCTMADDGEKYGCSFTTPFCATSASDPKHGQCVACRDDTGCTGSTPICDKSAGPTDDTCRGCNADADCTGKPAGSLCETQGPNAGNCVQCTSTNKSPCTGATPTCSPSTDTCVGCETNMDCSGGTPVCDITTKTCRACTQDSDCNGQGLCATAMNDPSKGKCVQCLKDSQCHPGFCDPGTDTCGACTPTAGCSNPKPVCGSGHMCTPCASDSDCANNKNGGVCQTAGAGAGSCAQCSPSNVAACTGATPACDPNSSACVACVATADCKDRSRVCASDHTCVACGGDAGACPGGGGGGGCALARAPVRGRTGEGAAVGALLALCAVLERRQRRAA
jgi:hypothetical protein